jgi:hypothetical protein
VVAKVALEQFQTLQVVQKRHSQVKRILAVEVEDHGDLLIILDQVVQVKL